MRLRIWWHRIRRRGVVIRDGKVYGYLTRDHYAHDARCIQIPHEVSAFHDVDGWGCILTDTVHPDLRWQAIDAQTFYETTGVPIARVKATWRNGIWLEGDAYHDTPDQQLVLSGDWRSVPDVGLSLIAVLQVTV